MAQFTTICVWFVITLIIGVASFAVQVMFLKGYRTCSAEHYAASWITSTLIAGIAITVLLVQNGLLQW